jgi:CMP-N,N'-diacetyllegionaminic acid synthase
MVTNAGHPPRVLAVIPARGGSKGLPGKNIRLFAGRPLIAHSIAMAAKSPEITRCVVSTDSAEIASVARENSGDVPFVRPAELATDNAPMMPVLRHALAEVEAAEGAEFDYVLLLDPTSPFRTRADLQQALEQLDSRDDLDGVVACSKPSFNPFWVGVVEGEQGLLQPAFDTAAKFVRRQDVPRFLRVNGALYLWRRSFILSAPEAWMHGRHAAVVIDELRATSIDTLEEFVIAELLVTNGLVKLDC